MTLSACHIANNQLRTTQLVDVEIESSTVKTFTFNDKPCAKAEPGQFLMLWIPGVDEIPLSILDTDTKDMVSVAVKRVGEATKALHNLRTGDIIGVRGPFGNSFSTKEGKVLMVGGGTGIAPLLFLARKLVAKDVTPFFVVGAKTKDELLFLKQLERLCDKGNVTSTTEDGSCGIAGLCTEPLEGMLSKERTDMVYSCGPEPMILKAFELARKYDLDMEASLERLMRCAIGLCGSCCVGKYRVCRDGPVFTRKQLQEVEQEFGKLKLDFDGRKVVL